MSVEDNNSDLFCRLVPHPVTCIFSFCGIRGTVLLFKNNTARATMEEEGGKTPPLSPKERRHQKRLRRRSGRGRRWLTLSGRVKVKRLRKGADGEDELVLPNMTSLDNNRFTLPVEVSCLSPKPQFARGSVTYQQLIFNRYS